MAGVHFEIWKKGEREARGLPPRINNESRQTKTIDDAIEELKILRTIESFRTRSSRSRSPRSRSPRSRSPIRLRSNSPIRGFSCISREQHEMMISRRMREERFNRLASRTHISRPQKRGTIIVADEKKLNSLEIKSKVNPGLAYLSRKFNVDLSFIDTWGIAINLEHQDERAWLNIMRTSYRPEFYEDLVEICRYIASGELTFDEKFKVGEISGPRRQVKIERIGDLLAMYGM